MRLGTWGGATSLRLFALQPRATLSLQAPAERDPARAALRTMAQALVADASGEVDRGLEAAAWLRGQRRFAVGLTMAAALTAGDPTLPAGVAQDQAQALYRQAVGIDAGLARAFLELGRAELARDQQTEAVELAEQASKAAPGWWPASALLIDALRARGFDQQSDAVLDRALAALPPTGEGGCRILQLAHDQAQARNRVAEEAALVERLSRCDAQSPVALERLRRQGDLKAAQALAGRQLGFSLDRQGLRNDLAALRLGLGDAVGAAGLLRASLDRSPGDAGLRVRLADAWQAAGRSAEARALLASTVRAFPGRETIRQVAIIAGLPLPLWTASGARGAR